MRYFASLFLLFVAPVVLVGCGTARPLKPVPLELIDSARLPDLGDVRTFGDSVEPWFVDSLAVSIREDHAYYNAHPEIARPSTVDLLALSGGGADGAYAAGLLCAWTKRGDRPNFRLVTGISTGALIAPMAFLGPEYDDRLREAYTTISERDVVSFRNVISMLSLDGLAETEPLREKIERWVDDETIAAVAREHQRGRRLFIATVHLRAQRAVIWDMGRIAASDHPDAPDLFRCVMLASASIPGAFEPQYFEVETPDGERYEEMHVDGGTVSQVFLWGTGVSLGDLWDRAGLDDVHRRPTRLFVIRNARIEPEYEDVPPRTAMIASRAVATLIKSQGIGDIIRLFIIARNNDIDFNVTSIPPAFTQMYDGAFDPKYMNALYEFAHQRMLSEDVWSKRPAGLYHSHEAGAEDAQAPSP